MNHQKMVEKSYLAKLIPSGGSFISSLPKAEEAGRYWTVKAAFSSQEWSGYHK